MTNTIFLIFLKSDQSGFKKKDFFQMFDPRGVLFSKVWYTWIFFLNSKSLPIEDLKKPFFFEKLVQRGFFKKVFFLQKFDQRGLLKKYFPKKFDQHGFLKKVFFFQNSLTNVD